MCGILGVRRSWLARRDAVERALAAMVWRGRDDRRLIAAGDWWLGVARLVITDPGTPQPLVCPETGRVVLSNGAVTSAAREWELAGSAARTRNDAELHLWRLRREGAVGLARTHGPFAFAIVDPAADHLWLARDAEGEKPLWVVRRRNGGVVAFASCVASLRALGLDVRLSAEEQARFLRFGFHLGPSLHGHDDLELLGAWRGVLEADAHGVRVVADSEPRATVGGSEQTNGNGTGGAPAAPLRERVLGAVERCAAAEVPVGLMLSGGVDSSCLAAALAVLGRRVPAYHFQALVGGEPADGGEEAERAAAVAAATGLELRLVRGGPEVLRSLVALTQATGLPQGDPSVVAVHALARAAAADGVRVLLGGEGADELWLGYRRQRAAAWLPRHGLGVPAPRWSMHEPARLWRALAERRPYEALLEASPPGFRAAVLSSPALQDVGLPGANGAGTALAQALAIDRDTYLRHDLLPKLDVALLAAGVEGRCPFLDPEVVAGAAHDAPAGRAAFGKAALKAAFRDLLPAWVLERRKRGFGVPLDRWFASDPFLADLLLEPRTLERPHVVAVGLRAAVARQRRHGRRREGAGLGHALWCVAALEVWWRCLEEDGRP